MPLEKHMSKPTPGRDFFEARAKQNEAQLEPESAQQRETRLNRERNSPTVSAEVSMNGIGARKSLQ
jgi:hypothetical protein